MATITFATRLQADGSLTFPQEAVEELGLHPGDEVQVQIELAHRNSDHPGQTMLERAIYAMPHRTPEQIAKAQARAMEAYPPSAPFLPVKRSLILFPASGQVKRPVHRSMPRSGSYHSGILCPGSPRYQLS